MDCPRLSRTPSVCRSPLAAASVSAFRSSCGTPRSQTDIHQSAKVDQRRSLVRRLPVRRPADHLGGLTCAPSSSPAKPAGGREPVAGPCRSDPPKPGGLQALPHVDACRLDLSEKVEHIALTQCTQAISGSLRLLMRSTSAAKLTPARYGPVKRSAVHAARTPDCRWAVPACAAARQAAIKLLKSRRSGS